MKDSVDIAILDMGGQYVQNFPRILGEIGVESKILPAETTGKELENIGVKGIILSGGPYSVYEDKSPILNKSIKDLIYKKNVPALGVCYGHQLLAKSWRGSVISTHLT